VPAPVRQPRAAARPAKATSVAAPDTRAARVGAPPLAWSAAVGAVFAAIYLALAPAVTGPKDSSEFTLALALGTAAHPTGYPLFILLGHPFVLVLHALGATWAYAANAWSAAGAGVAMGLLHALGARLVPPGVRLARSRRFALALIPVYSWHLAWVCAACLFVVAMARAFAAERAPWSGRRLATAAALWGLLCGIGMAHHVTAALQILALTAALALAGARAGLARPKYLLLAIAASLVPLASYAFVAWRAFHPAAYQWPTLEPSWRAVFDHVLGQSYRDLLGRFAPTGIQAEMLRRWCWPVLFPALIGLVVAAIRARGAERVIVGGLLAAALLQALYAFNYGVLDPSSYFEPAMALALLAIPALGASLVARRRSVVAPAVAVAILVAVPAVWGLWDTDGARRGDLIVSRRIRALWASLPSGPCLVFWRHDMATTLRVFQILERSRADVYAQNPDALTWPGPRRDFERRFGFDPLAGLEPLTAEKVAAIPDNVNRLTRLPVVLFDLEGITLHTLDKPRSP